MKYSEHDFAHQSAVQIHARFAFGVCVMHRRRIDLQIPSANAHDCVCLDVALLRPSMRVIKRSFRPQESFERHILFSAREQLDHDPVTLFSANCAVR